MQSRPSQYHPGQEVPEKSWATRHWFNDFGTYAAYEGQTKQATDYAEVADHHR